MPILLRKTFFALTTYFVLYCGCIANIQLSSSFNVNWIYLITSVLGDRVRWNFHFRLVPFRDAMIEIKRSGIFPPCRWCNGSLDVQDGRCNIFFSASRISHFNFWAFLRPWSDRWSWIKIMEHMLCLITWTFCIGVK